MKKILKPKEVVYSFNVNYKKEIDGSFILPQYEEVYKEIKTALLLNSYGYNIYVIEEFCKERVKHIIDYASHILKGKKPPKDICYVVKEDSKEPIPLVVENGHGIKLKETLERVQNEYAETVFKFYNALDNKEKEELITVIKDRRSKIVEDLVELSKSFGFDIKVGEDGFTFVPLMEGKEMTEDEYDNLSEEKKQEILARVKELKISANNILERLRNMSNSEIDRIKEILRDFLKNELLEIKEEIKDEFKEDEEILKYFKDILYNIEEEIIDNYSISYEDDEEKIKEVIFKYDINVVVDNSKAECPPVIYEEDPSVSNLLGSIEYENHNNMYVSNVDSIRVGSLVRANEGCLILRASSLLSNSQAYYYLKKSLITETVDLDYNRGYLELFTLGSLKPVPLKVKTKVIIIGDYETFELLFNYDKEFKNIFRVKGEYKGILDINENIKSVFINEVEKYIKENNLTQITTDGLKEIAKYLSRKAENRNKLYFDYDEIANLLLLSDCKAREAGRNKIEAEDIVQFAYKVEEIEKEYVKLFEENKILLEVSGSKVGQINALSVINLGYTSFGKPTRITCTCWNGEGKIIDAQRESSLSGKIHTKGINILKGYINNLNGGVKKLPLDFNLSFEQLYGLIDGDSASAAEAIAIVSALCKIPIKQNIAITGSINQFGVIQPIGGVNEKIEGYFKVCALKDKVKGKGVIIPLSNVKELVLSKEVEKAIKERKFTIYAVEYVEEAMEIIFDMEEINIEKVKGLIEQQYEIYNSENKN